MTNFPYLPLPLWERMQGEGGFFLSCLCLCLSLRGELFTTWQSQYLSLNSFYLPPFTILNLFQDLSLNPVTEVIKTRFWIESLGSTRDKSGMTYKGDLLFALIFLKAPELLLSLYHNQGQPSYNWLYVSLLFLLVYLPYDERYFQIKLAVVLETLI